MTKDEEERIEDEFRELRNRELASKHEANLAQRAFFERQVAIVHYPILLSALGVIISIIALGITAWKVTADSKAAAATAKASEEAARAQAISASHVSMDLSVEPAAPLGDSNYWLLAHVRLTNNSKRPNQPLVVSWSISEPPPAGGEKLRSIEFWNDAGFRGFTDDAFSEIYPGQSIELHGGRAHIKTASSVVLLHVDVILQRGVDDEICHFDEKAAAGADVREYVQKLDRLPFVSSDVKNATSRGCIVWSAERFVPLGLSATPNKGA